MLNTDTIVVTQELLALLSEIDEFKGAWRALSTIAPERLSALRRVATIESVGSSTRIEGSKLSDRELQTLLMIASGKRLADIAEELTLSPKTVSVYRARVLEKLGLANNSELTVYAIRNGLVGQ